MMEELQRPDLVDPLTGLSTFSLFPRTFGDLREVANSQQPDLESVHNHLKSMALRSPNKLLEQANTILRNKSGLRNPELPFQMASEDTVAAKGNDHPPERRPALNRKRTRFSLKPTTSQPPLDMNPSLNIDQLEDPEEFFLAHEKLENAKMELRKQRGDALMDLDQYNLTETTRNRRPGLLGKRASFKHHGSLLDSEGDNTVVSSQESFEVGNSSPSKCGPDLETTSKHEAPEEKKIAGAEHVDATQEEGLKEERIGQHLDELLSSDCMDLDENGVFTFLQERLQLKPINLDKLTLPGLDSIIRNDLKAPVEKLAKPRKALTDIHNTVGRASGKTSGEHRKLLAVSDFLRPSPPPTKSPLASLSFLQRRISQMTSPQVDGKGSSSTGELQSKLTGTGGKTAVNNLYSGKMATEHLTSSSDRPDDENPNGEDASRDVRSNGYEGCSEDKVEDVLEEALTSDLPDIVFEGLTVDPLSCSDSQLDQLGHAAGEHCSVDGQAETRAIPLEQNDEEHELNSGTPPNMQTKPKPQARKRGIRSKASLRQSLAGAGSLWESGVRRSSRIKVKPLEWWNGERLLYGRIHNSLETVIGLKYVSPAKDGGKPTIRVKSYVPDEYKHLVEQAGLH